ncbi:trafficking protein particle complex subunit 1 [Accipiter gentilis]|uniref:trafficking protein particle complex subunit 1 n=1 Tax=Astur gentilis TaxID=8957 RepID=UPI0021108D5C|nr:trafficking protein particle complex subunit 1 [Accipiter gentilis]
MTIHNLYIFDRAGTCLHYSEWHRRRQAGIPKEEEFKLMFGMLFSLRSFVGKMSPTDMRDGFISFHTSKYRLHYYETPTGLRLVLNTDLSVACAREALHHIYSNLFVELVVKNPLCPPRQPVQSELFRSRLDTFVRGLPFFAPPPPPEPPNPGGGTPKPRRPPQHPWGGRGKHLCPPGGTLTPPPPRGCPHTPWRTPISLGGALHPCGHPDPPPGGTDPPRVPQHFLGVIPPQGSPQDPPPKRCRAPPPRLGAPLSTGTPTHGCPGGGPPKRNLTDFGEVLGLSAAGVAAIAAGTRAYRAPPSCEAAGSERRRRRREGTRPWPGRRVPVPVPRCRRVPEPPLVLSAVLLPVQAHIRAGAPGDGATAQWLPGPSAVLWQEQPQNVPYGKAAPLPSNVPQQPRATPTPTTTTL